MEILIVPRVDVIPPTVPTISAIATSATSARVSLTEPSSDASGIGEYRLERSLDGSTGWSQVAAGASIFPFDDEDLDPETDYYYRARSADAATVPNVSGYSGVVDITTDALDEWTNPDATLIDFSPAGTPKNVSFAQFVPPGSTAYRLHSSSAPLPDGVTLDSENRRFVDDGEEGAISDVSGVILEDYTDALADFEARAGGEGVLWVQRFQSAAADIEGWQHSSSESAYNPDRQQFIAGGGIIPGDGALRQVYQGGEDWGGGSWRWCRPIQPMVGDVNQPGVAELDRQPAHYWFQNRVIASVMHTDYQAAHGSPLRTGPFIANEIYFQLWVKLSPGRTTDSNAPAGKLIMLESAYQNTTNELVMTVGPSSRRIGSLYANKGSGFNSGLEEPQANGGSSSGRRQPGSDYAIPSGPLSGQSASNVCTFNNAQTHGWSNACWVWPEGEWVNWLLRFKPGHQYISSTVTSSANDPVRDTEITTWAATATDIRAGRGYTRIHHKTNYVWEYDNSLRFGASAAYQPYGINWFSLNHFTGGNDWVITPLTFWHQFDQIIASTAPIPCPTVAPEA